MKSLYTLLCALLLTCVGFGQSGVWQRSNEGYSINRINRVPGLPELSKGTLFKLNLDVIRSLAATARQESAGITKNTVILSLPMPDGSFQKFYVYESSLMEPALAAKYPDIKSYLIKGVDDAFAAGRISISADGFHAFFASLPTQMEVYIKKVAKGTAGDDYISFLGKDDPARTQPTGCLRNGFDTASSTGRVNGTTTGRLNVLSPIDLRVFRMAMSVAGEVPQQYGWTTKGQVLANVVSYLGEINTVYERDLAIRFVLPDGEDALIFLNAATDPFTTAGTETAMAENQVITDQLLGSGNYDVGLVFVRGACCAAGVGVVCLNGQKARNFSVMFQLQNTTHEIGHQFGSGHAWTYCGGPANGGNSVSELAAGATIMAYPNICGINSFPDLGSITYFGIRSIEKIEDYISGVNCYKKLASPNYAPIVTVPMGGFSIPKSTPFTLTGSATDAEGDALTYSWEQYNIYSTDYTATLPLATAPTAADGNVPIFRTYNPVTTPIRTFPKLADILSNTASNSERLPTYTRNLKFKLYARDNHAGTGGNTSGLVSFEVDGTAGPFLISAPNTAVTWAAGSSQTITWDVANTTNATVNCQNVKISLSTDGGYTWLYVLAATTTNDGSETVTIPAGLNTSKARIKVEALGNIFFDISNADFTIGTPASSQPNIASLHFDGTDDKVNLGNTLSNFGTGDFTIEMWVKTAATGTRGLIAKKNTCNNFHNYWALSISGGKLRMETFESAATTNFNFLNGRQTINNNTWRHVAVTRAGTSIKLYVDGLFDTTGVNTGNTTNLNNTWDLLVGYSLCPNSYYPGSMDEVRIWNVARTEAEIAGSMNCRFTRTETGLQALYHFDDGTPNTSNSSVTTVTNSVSAGSNGTLSGFALTGTTSNFITAYRSNLYTSSGTITITTQPASQAVAVNIPVTLSAAAVEDVSYQWQVKIAGASSFTNISSAAVPTLNLTMTGSLHNAQYRCVLSNGCGIVYSNIATLTMSCAASPALSTITGSAAPCTGVYASYYVSPNNEITTWNWAVPAGWEITKYDNMIMVRPNSTAGPISVTAINACGITTATQTFLATPITVSITGQPAPATVAQGGNTGFTVAIATGGGSTTYQWQHSTDGGATFTSISGATSATYSLTAVPLSYDDRQYRCIVNNSCLSDTSDAAALTVTCSSAPAAPGAISGSNLFCSGNAVTYSVANVPGADSYIWTLPSGWTGSSAIRSILATTGSIGGVVTVKAANSCGTSPATSINVNLNPVACENAVHFDGTDDYLEVPRNTTQLTGDLTVSFWVKPERTSGLQTLVFKGREFGVLLSGNDLQYRHFDNDGTYEGSVILTYAAGVDVATGVWQHVAFVRNVADNNVSLYLNGSFVQTQNYADHDPDPDTALNIIFGANTNGGSQFFKGQLDEIKVWNTSRTAAEISNDRYCVPTGSETGLQMHYGFMQGVANGNNPGVVFTNAATAFGNAVPRNLALIGTTSNVTDGNNRTRYLDADGDGFGSTTNVTNTCASGNYVLVGGDCNDDNPLINPKNQEVADETDNNCNGVVDENAGLHFDGVDDYVFINNITWPRTTTFEGWMKADSYAGATNRVIFHWNAAVGGADLYAEPDGRLVYAEYDAGTWNGYYMSSIPNDGAWHHYAIVRNEATGTVIMYRDGQQTGLASMNKIFTATSLQIGQISGSQWFGGIFDEWSQWNYAKSATEIGADMICANATSNPAALLYFDFNNGVPNSDNTGRNYIYDYSGNNKTGTLYGFALNGTAGNFVDGHALPLWYKDNDGDGVGTTAITKNACTQPSGYVAIGGDCDDNNVAISPKAKELPDGIDNNCNGVVDENTGLHFDGTNDYITIDNVNYPATATFEAWIKLDAMSPAANRTVANWTGSGGAKCYIDANGGIYYQETNSDGSYQAFTCSSPVTDLNWHHIAIVRTAGSPVNVKVYKDGVLVANYSLDRVFTTTKLYIGSTNGTSDPFKGIIDEVAAWNVAKTAAQIAADMACTNPAGSTGLLYYFDFNQGAPAADNTGRINIFDFSGNSKYGTLSNFALTGTTSNFTDGYTGVEINMKGNSNTIYSGDITPSAADNTSFGTTTSGTAVTRTFTIENTGTKPLIISSAIITGGNTNGFTITTAPAGTVTAGGSTTFTVSFNPTGAGTMTDVVKIASNDCDESLYTFTISGSSGCSPAQAPTLTKLGSTNVNCNSGNDGTLKVKAAGGSGSGYTFSINGGAFASGTATDEMLFTGLAAGTYNVLVKDGSGCTSTALSHTVTQPTGTVADVNLTSYTYLTSFPDGASRDMILTVTEIGGHPAQNMKVYLTEVAGYTYSLPAVTTITLGANTYTVDNSNWSKSSSGGYTVLQFTLPVATLSCSQSLNLGVRITRSGGAAGFFPLSTVVSGVATETNTSNNTSVRQLNGN